MVKNIVRLLADMLVTRIKTTPLAIPFKETYYYSQGAAAGANSILVEVETDEGITGIGEACADRSATAVLGAVKAAARILEGTNPFDIERFIYRFYREAKWDDMRRFANQALAGVEMALWDIVGKAAALPVHALLGGAFHDRINHFGFLQGDEPAKLADNASMWQERGFDVLYLKVGRGRRRDLDCVEAIRKRVGPDLKLRVDANMAWTVGEAIQELNHLQPYDIDFAEQPVSWADLDGLARVREAVSMPIAIDQGCFTEQEALEVIKRKAADVIVVGLHETGGIAGLRKLAAVAGAAAVPICRHGVMGETGVTTLASLQALASVPNLTRGNQVMHQLFESDIVPEGLIHFEGGDIVVPQRPGLGVELDRERVRHYADVYEKQGPFWPC
jgi:L-alanine-DL-glutamate epimerase-like enolase superfamily enzyme